MTREFEFSFEGRYRVPALLFGITPMTTRVTVTDDELLVRFGVWRLRTPLTNVTETTETGGFAWHRTAGPPHLSLTDHGITFATNSRRGLCVSFAEPVKAMEPTGKLLRHPGMTVTVADTPGLATALAR